MKSTTAMCPLIFLWVCGCCLPVAWSNYCQGRNTPPAAPHLQNCEPYDQIATCCGGSHCHEGNTCPGLSGGYGAIQASCTRLSQKNQCPGKTPADWLEFLRSGGTCENAGNCEDSYVCMLAIVINQLSTADSVFSYGMCPRGNCLLGGAPNGTALISCDFTPYDMVLYMIDRTNPFCLKAVGEQGTAFLLSGPDAVRPQAAPAVAVWNGYDANTCNELFIGQPGAQSDAQVAGGSSTSTFEIVKGVVTIVKDLATMIAVVAKVAGG